MPKKIYPNDPCPCGSGKKYKQCCGKTRLSNISNLNRSDKPEEDFIIDRIYEDLDFFEFTIAIVLGPVGSDYCSKHFAKLDEKLSKGEMKNLAEEDVIGVYKLISEDSDFISQYFSTTTVSPYGGVIPEKQEDIISLDKKGYFYSSGIQVELFHFYLMHNLNRRFDDYFYLPNEKRVKNNDFGPIAHRGYDFLFAMTIYLEMQLGIHVYFDKKDLTDWRNSKGKEVIDYFNIQDYKIPDGMLYVLSGYKEVLTDIDNRFNNREELQTYFDMGAFQDSILYDRYLKMLDKGENNYVEYLRSLIITICFHDFEASYQVSKAFSQCDFWKYLVGMNSIQMLFEDRVSHVPINLDNMDSDEWATFVTTFNFELLSSDLDKSDIYHRTVFYWADELNGNYLSRWSKELTYNDFPKVFTASEIDENGKPLVNPARKSVLLGDLKPRKLRLEIYQILNGRMVDFLGVKGDGFEGGIFGRYPVIPWLSSGKENTVHIKKIDKDLTYKDLFSDEIELRQQYLGMELRLTEIPVNCIEEFLIPEVYCSWDSQHELLNEIKEKNERLNKQIALNQELVRNLSHSSVNYLNPDKLAATGVELRNADGEHPELEELHVDGHSLLLQSEQETFMTRQLNSLVWRCNADLTLLSEQIRGGLQEEGGVKVIEPVGFAIKSVLARILFRENDIRSKFIREKIIKTEEEWQSTRDSFVQEILTDEGTKGNVIFDWWNSHIGTLNVNISNYWDKIRVAPEKAFFDLITEIITEQILNALSHGDLSKEITINFGIEDKQGRPPRWAYICCENSVGERYRGGGGVGNKTLHETLFMLNNEQRGLETGVSEKNFFSKAWLSILLLKPLS